MTPTRVGQGKKTPAFASKLAAVCSSFAIHCWALQRAWRVTREACLRHVSLLRAFPAL